MESPVAKKRDETIDEVLLRRRHALAQIGDIG